MTTSAAFMKELQDGDLSPDLRDSVTLGTLTWGGLLVGTLTWGGLLVGGPVGALVGWGIGHVLGGAAVGALFGATVGGFYASDRLASNDAPLFPSRS